MPMSSEYTEKYQQTECKDGLKEKREQTFLSDPEMRINFFFKKPQWSLPVSHSSHIHESFIKHYVIWKCCLEFSWGQTSNHANNIKYITTPKTPNLTFTYLWRVLPNTTFRGSITGFCKHGKCSLNAKFRHRISSVLGGMMSAWSSKATRCRVWLHSQWNNVISLQLTGFSKGHISSKIWTSGWLQILEDTKFRFLF